VHALRALDADAGFGDQIERGACLPRLGRVFEERDEVGIGPFVGRDALALGQPRLERQDVRARIEGGAHRAAHRAEQSLALEFADFEFTGEAEHGGGLAAG
jgi:hypothetical protein